VCGRFTTRTPPDELARRFGVDVVVAPDLGARYNIAPTLDVYAVAEVAGERRLGALRWGLVPPWAPDPSVGSRMINARAERVAGAPAYRRALRRRRCLVPADGFYEWRRGSGRPAPHLVRRVDGAPLALAGLWERWRPPSGGPDLVTCTIVTTEANATVASLHDRMPVVLAPEHWDAWLDPAADDVEALQALLVPAPAGDLEVVRAHPDVGDVRNDGPWLLEPPPEPVEAPLPGLVL
jgi:putative SOS response-associated peptidase YedK